MTAHHDQLFLKPSEAAKRLNTDLSSIYLWMNDGTLPSVLVASEQRRIPVGALETFARRREPGVEDRERREIAAAIRMGERFYALRGSDREAVETAITLWPLEDRARLAEGAVLDPEEAGTLTDYGWALVQKLFPEDHQG